MHIQENRNNLGEIKKFNSKEDTQAIVNDVRKLLGDTETTLAVTALLKTVTEILSEEVVKQAEANGDTIADPIFIGFENECRLNGRVITVQCRPDYNDPQTLRTILAHGDKSGLDDATRKQIEFMLQMLDQPCQCDKCQTGNFEA